MTTTTVPTPSAGTARSGRDRGGTDALFAVGVCAVVAVLAQLPLINNRVFYYWDDSSAQFLPMWYRLGHLVADGGWPPLLDLETWMGGNLAAEALFGIYNPVNIANYLMVAALPDLGLAAILVKTEFLVLLALGTHLVCREYGASRPAAGVVAVALPFSGYLLYFDASAWASGLIAFAYLPHVWWSARKAACGRLNPFWAFVIAALAVTVGNPYGVLGVAVVFAGLLVEFGLRRMVRQARLTFLLGACAALVVPLVFLPLLGSTSVTWRSDTGVVNDGFLVPGVTDLLASSTPTHLPRMPVFTGYGLNVPAGYFAWFVLPLLPWLNWRVLRTRWRPLAGPLVVTGVFAVLALGPTKTWLFRWPLRHVEYCFLGAAVLVALVLSAGLRTDRPRARSAGTAAILLFGTYLAWAAWPPKWQWHVGGLLLVAVLTATALRMYRAGPGRFAAALAVGTAAVLGYQLAAFPTNTNVSELHYPHSVAELRDTFADRYEGEVMQIADMRIADDTLGLRPDGAWRYFLFGNVYAAAGVESLVSYTGIGFTDFADTFCLNNVGSTTCPEAWDALWKPTRFARTPLADLLGVQTVVVQNALVPDVRAPRGWRVTERDSVVTVLRRQAALPWPNGTLSWAAPGVEVVADRAPEPTAETVRFTVDDPSSARELVFARLAWPGYTATVAGQDVPVRRGPAGLVTVRLPSGVDAGELTLRWTPPGQTTGLAGAALGVLGALALGAARSPLARRFRGSRLLRGEAVGTAPPTPERYTRRRSEAQRESS